MNKTQINKIAAPVINAIVAAEQSQIKIGDAVLAAATKLDEKSIKPFCDAVKASLERKGFTPASVKVTTMYIRRVLTAIIIDGFEPEPGQSLRSIYASLPKSKTGGASHTRKINKGSDDSDPEENDEPAADSTATAADRFKSAVELLFGGYDADLLAAVQYATENKKIFISWAQASAAAAALTAEKPAAKVPTKRKKAIAA